MTRGFLLDLNRCTGCQACRLACRIENGMESAGEWRAITTFNELRHPEIPLFHLSLACSHCADAPCMTHCPALAFSRDPATDSVILDTARCIGCRYCSWACPFGAPRYNASSGVVTKCTLCRHRLIENLKPACVTHCPTVALDYGELDSMGVAAVAGFPQTDFRPSIRFIALRGSRPAPECTAAAAIEPDLFLRDLAAAPAASMISLKTEWPLAAFTLLAAVLVGLAAAAAIGHVRLDPAAFPAAAALSLGISALHLGRKLRSWRAILNVKHSWLSREIVFYSAFVLLSAARLVWLPSNAAFGWVAAAAGFAALYAIDRVYGPALKKVPAFLHSAGALLTGIFLAGALLANPVVAGLAGVVKLGLYLYRKLWFYRRRLPLRLPLAVLRLGSAALWLYLPGAQAAFALSFLLAGELIDRLEYYLELEVRSPRRQAAEDLRRAVGEGSAGR